MSPPFVSGNVLSVFVAGCFFLSGAAGLVYEVIWVRLIDKVLGSAPFAVATVLSVFMAGLALGSYLSGRVVDRFARRRDLLFMYGVMELGIGICALLAPLLMKAVQPFYQAIYDRLLGHFWCYQIAAFAGCVLILVVPTALMGATLPVLCRFYVLRLTHIGARTGWLYGLNTVGAALGVVLCGFVLIKTLGVWGSLALFAGINGVIGLSCMLLSRVSTADGNRPTHKRAGRATHQSATVMMRHQDAGGPMRVGVSIFAVSGFCAMAYEVMWTRLLGLVAGPTTYCFTLVVATFIVGLAVGSILFGRLADQTHHALGWLAGTQMAAALTALAVSQLLGNGQFFFAKLIHTFQGQFSHLVLMQSLVLFFMLLPPTLFLGAAFPLVNRLYVQSIGTMGRNLGTAYAVNTLGALAGSFAAGFVLVPWLGKMNGLRLVILLQFSLAGLSLCYLAFLKNRNGRLRWAVVGLISIGWLLMGHFPNWRTDLLSRGWYRDVDALQADLDRSGWGEALADGARRIADHRQGLEVVFQGEGAGGFTTVEKITTDDEPNAIDHYNLALAHIAGGEKTPAVNDLRTAVRLDTNNEPALTALGLLLAETGSLDEAALLLTHAVGLAPRKAEPYKYLGMVELRRSAHDRAVIHLSAALDLAPDDDVILSELGTAYLLQGNSRKAVAYLTKALGKNPQDHQSRYYLKIAEQKLEAEK